MELSEADCTQFRKQGTDTQTDMKEKSEEFQKLVSQSAIQGQKILLPVGGIVQVGMPVIGGIVPVEGMAQSDGIVPVGQPVPHVDFKTKIRNIKNEPSDSDADSPPTPLFMQLGQPVDSNQSEEIQGSQPVQMGQPARSSDSVQNPPATKSEPISMETRENIFLDSFLQSPSLDTNKLQGSVRCPIDIDDLPDSMDNFGNMPATPFSIGSFSGSADNTRSSASSAEALQTPNKPTTQAKTHSFASLLQEPDSLSENQNEQTDMSIDSLMTRKLKELAAISEPKRYQSDSFLVNSIKEIADNMKRRGSVFVNNNATKSCPFLKMLEKDFPSDSSNPHKVIISRTEQKSKFEVTSSYLKRSLTGNEIAKNVGPPRKGKEIEKTINIVTKDTVAVKSVTLGTLERKKVKNVGPVTNSELSIRDMLFANKSLNFQEENPDMKSGLDIDIKSEPDSDCEFPMKEESETGFQRKGQFEPALQIKDDPDSLDSSITDDMSIEPVSVPISKPAIPIPQQKNIPIPKQTIPIPLAYPTGLVKTEDPSRQPGQASMQLLDFCSLVAKSGSQDKQGGATHTQIASPDKGTISSQERENRESVSSAPKRNAMRKNDEVNPAFLQKQPGMAAAGQQMLTFKNMVMTKPKEASQSMASIFQGGNLLRDLLSMPKPQQNEAPPDMPSGALHMPGGARQGPTALDYNCTDVLEGGAFMGVLNPFTPLNSSNKKPRKHSTARDPMTKAMQAMLPKVQTGVQQDVSSQSGTLYVDEKGKALSYIPPLEIIAADDTGKMLAKFEVNQDVNRVGLQRGLGTVKVVDKSGNVVNDGRNKRKIPVSVIVCYIKRPQFICQIFSFSFWTINPFVPNIKGNTNIPEINWSLFIILSFGNFAQLAILEVSLFIMNTLQHRTLQHNKMHDCLKCMI